MTPCANLACFGKAYGQALCSSCQDKKESAILACICLAVTVFILVLAKIGERL